MQTHDGTTLIAMVGVMCIAASLAGCGADGNGSGESMDLTSSESSAESSTPGWVGNYSGNGGSMSSVVVKNWGGNPLLTGYYSYGGNYLPVQYLLKPTGYDDLRYEGGSSLSLDFSDGTRCTYPVSLQATFQSNDGEMQLFLRHNIPQQVPLEIVGGQCVTERNFWQLDANPYVKR